MPLDQRTYDLETEADRLYEEMEDAAEEQAEYPPGSNGAQATAERGQRAERLRYGVRWAQREWGVDEVTLAALTNGNRRLIAKLRDENPELDASDCYVAAGSVDAPYVEHDSEAIDPNDLLETVYAVADLSPKFVDWAESRVAELGRVEDDEGKSYQTLVRERRNSEA